MIRTRRPVTVALKRKHLWPGLGVLNYYDLLAQANLQACDPMDSACVSNNTAKQAAVEDYWAAHQSTGVPDGTKLSFTPQTSAQVLEYYNPADLINSGNVVDDRGIMTINGAAPPPVIPPIQKPVPNLPNGTPATVKTTPQGQVIVNSSGAAQPAYANPLGQSDILDTLQSIPWYVYAGAGVAALFAFKGAK